MKKIFIALITTTLLLISCTSWNECGNCNGNGYLFFDNNHHREECPTCGGSGRLTND